MCEPPCALAALPEIRVALDPAQDGAPVPLRGARTGARGKPPSQCSSASGGPPERRWRAVAGQCLGGSAIASASGVAERVQHVNRIKGLLATQGINDYQPLRRGRSAGLEALRTCDGHELTSHANARDPCRSTARIGSRNLILIK